MIVRYRGGKLANNEIYLGSIWAPVTAGTTSGTNAGGGTTPGTALSVSPSAVSSAFSQSVTLTANLPSTWSTNIGSIVAAGDGLSAVFTAPASKATGTITVTEINDPTQQVSVPVQVSQAYMGGFVDTSMAGAAGLRNN